MAKAVKVSFGKIDFLVNNAGITRDKLLALMAENDWDDVINTNLKVFISYSKAVITQMIKQKAGSILNITSVSGIIGMAGPGQLFFLKAGMIGFTKALAKEVGKVNVTVNAIACGFIETDMTAVLPQEYKDKVIEMIPVRRFGKAEDVAKTAVFLLSNNARYITGHVINVDGGLAM